MALNDLIGRAKAPHSSTLTVTGVVALGVLLFSGLGWVGSLRTEIRRVLGVDASPQKRRHDEAARPAAHHEAVCR